jgi:hypothetical protein
MVHDQKGSRLPREDYRFLPSPFRHYRDMCLHLVSRSATDLQATSMCLAPTGIVDTLRCGTTFSPTPMVQGELFTLDGFGTLCNGTLRLRLLRANLSPVFHLFYSGACRGRWTRSIIPTVFFSYRNVFPAGHQFHFTEYDFLG